MKKKIISFILVLTIFTTTLHKLGIAKVYADNGSNMTMTEIDESLIYTPNEKSIAITTGLVSSYAVPVALNIMITGIIGLGIAETLKSEDVRTLLTGLGGSSGAGTHQTPSELKNHIGEKIMNLHASTIGFLILAGAYNSDTLTDVEDEMEESGWSPQFIQSVKDDLGGGSSGDGGDQEPKGKIEWGKIVKYGASILVTSTFLGGIWNFIKNILPTTDKATDGTFPPLTSVSNYQYRWVDLPLKSTGKYTDNNAFKMRVSKDLNMDLVQQVSIQMSDIQYYNYGWDGVAYSHEYLLNSVDGKQFIFMVIIGKALSPNQYTDIERDGIVWMFYELNSDMTPNLTSEYNSYNSYVDYTRLSLDGRLNVYKSNLGFKIGTTHTLNHLKSSSDPYGINALRELAKTALGADLFSQLKEGETFAPVSASSEIFIDASRGIQGVYNNKWQLIEGSSIFPTFDSNAFEMYFPQSIPTGTSSIYKDKDTIKEVIGDSQNPGSVITRPSKDQTVSKPTVENIFNPAKPGQTETVEPSKDIPTEEELDKLLPGDKTDTDNPGDTDTDNPPTTTPGLPDFGDITVPSIDLTPLQLSISSITEKFPFSLPWDIKRIAETFKGNSSVNAPIIEFEFNNQNVTLDFNRFNAIAMIIRGFVFVEFAIGLIFVTRKLKP